jgi:disulfide bond formation protein DsbB
MPIFKHAMKLPSTRICFGLVAAFCFTGIAIALVMQYFFDMPPCPLCITQRIAMIAVGILALLAFFLTKGPKTGMSFSILSAIAAVLGAIVAGRHVYIQNLPEDQAPLCGPTLEYMFKTRPMFEAVELLFRGDGHCADVHFQFLGLTLPGWTLVTFVALLIACLFLFWRSLKRR